MLVRMLSAPVILLVFMLSNVQAVTPGQLDDFQDGTTMNWHVAAGPNGGMPPFPPVNADGGPAGNGDLFLQLTSTGGMGAGSRMVVLNGSQWGGDYLSSGVTGISMDVNNLGGIPLELRMRFEHFSAMGPPTGDFLSSDSVTVPAASGWQNVFFPISETDLMDVTMGMGDDFATTLGDVGIVRLLHSPDGTLPPPPIDSLLGVDNITAIPEPGFVWSVLLVAFLAGSRKSVPPFTPFTR